MKKLVVCLLVVTFMFALTGCKVSEKIISEVENTLSSANVNSSRELDYDAIIDSFVESGLNTFELYVGETHAPNASIWLKSGMGSVYTSDENVVNVTELGKVTALHEGSAYVIISAMGNTMYEVYRYDVFSVAPEADLSNVPQIEGLDFLKEIENFNETKLNTIELKVGQTHSPTASVWAKNGGECFTSDAAVVTVTADGTITAEGRGTAYVIIKAGIGTMLQMYKYIVK